MFWPSIIGNVLAYLWCAYQFSAERTTWRAWYGPISTRPRLTSSCTSMSLCRRIAGLPAKNGYQGFHRQGQCPKIETSFPPGSGGFYAAGIRSPEARLRYYAQVFPIVEVDATSYALPPEQNARLWVERTRPGFAFKLKPM